VIHPRVLFVGNPAAATPWVGLAKKLARECYDLKIANKVYKLGSGVIIRVENIIPIVGKLAGISKVWIEAGVEVLFDFILHPHSDLAVNGWWFSSELETERSVKATPHYPIHSIRFVSPAWINEWTYSYQRQNALYQDDKLTRDQYLWCGNQFFTKDGPTVENKTYWSWWHSPCGDGPCPVNIDSTPRQRLTPYMSSSNGSLLYLANSSSPYIQPNLTPCLFKNGVLFWSYSDQNITDTSNVVDTDDVMVIGGVYPVSDSRLLVVIVSNVARTATFYDIKIVSSSSWTKTTLLTLSNTSINNSMRWPWRFNSTGTECVTIVELFASPVYSYIIWTVSITYNEETDAYSAVLSDTDTYTARITNVTTGSYSASLSGGTGTETSNSSMSRSVESEYSRIPYAVSYDNNDNKVIAWYDISNTTGSNASSLDYNVINDSTGTNSIQSSSSNVSKIDLVIGTKTISLEDITRTTTTNDFAEILGPVGPNEPYLTYDLFENGSVASYVFRILFIDVSKQFVIIGYETSMVDNSSSMSEVWTPNELWAVKLAGTGSANATYSRIINIHKGATTNCLNDTYNKVLSTDLYLDPLEAYNETYFYNLAYGITKNQSFPLDNTTYNYIRLSSVLDFVGYGAAIDANGRYIFSYDWAGETVNIAGSSQVVPRSTGNKSNIPGFSAAISAIPGDNVLLYPLGLT